MIHNSVFEIHTRRASEKLAVLLVIAILFLSAPRPSLAAEGNFNHDYPRLANYFLKWGISDSETIELAKWDFVIIDMEAQAFTPESLRKLRSLNPQIKILAYITAQEIRKDAGQLESNTLRFKLASQIPDSWYLKNNSGQRLTWWPGTFLLNVTEQAPVSNSKKWNDLLPEFIANNVISSGLWDGVLYDNVWGGASWLNYTLDLNLDGRAESFKDQDSEWQKGMRKILNRTRELLGPDKLIVANDGIAYYQIINGSLFEHFPNRGWLQTMRNYFLIQNRATAPSLGILNSNTGNTGRQDFRQVRFGLASALLNDGYFSYDYGDQDHSQLWWFDEYSTFLGKPKGEVINLLNSASANLVDSLWRRDFENGVVLLNSTAQARGLDLNGEFEKLHGIQDPVTNDGLIVDSVNLPAGDGIILLRPLESIKGATFTNGSFVRVFDRSGNTKRTGFFTYLNKFRGSANIFVADLNNDGLDETLVADQGRLKFFNSFAELIREITPYGPAYKRGFNFAVNDLDNDGLKEIVTAPDKGGGPHIRIFNQDGVLINSGFFAYEKNFRGGVNLALGDLDGDGFKEIVTAPASGRSPEVKIFDRNGRPIAQNNNSTANFPKGGSFFPYQKSFRGGVSLAVGDYNGDGRAELVTAQASGGVQIKVFDAAGKLQYHPFEAFKTNKQQGVKVIALDLDGDRATEILATSTRAFTVSVVGNNIGIRN